MPVVRRPLAVLIANSHTNQALEEFFREEIRPSVSWLGEEATRLAGLPPSTHASAGKGDHHGYMRALEATDQYLFQVMTGATQPGSDDEVRLVGEIGRLMAEYRGWTPPINPALIVGIVPGALLAGGLTPFELNEYYQDLEQKKKRAADAILEHEKRLAALLSSNIPRLTRLSVDELFAWQKLQQDRLLLFLAKMLRAARALAAEPLI